MTEIPDAKLIYGEKIMPVFVGREEDLIYFSNHWKINDEEFSIIKIANMPGIGKTEVVKQFYRTFGMQKMENEQPLLIHINCKNIIPTLNKINSISDAYKLTRKMKDNIIPQIEFYYDLTGDKDEFDRLMDYINEIIEYKEDFWSFMVSIFNSEFLKDKYRLFFFDEIQALYGKGVESILSERKIISAEEWVKNNPGKKVNKNNCKLASLRETVKYYQQGAFREMSYMMSELISPDTLIFVSGTEYSLLNSLGDLGSPVQGRVSTHNLSRLSGKESREWIDKEISGYSGEIWENICEMVVQLSGGIPRILSVYIGKLKNINNVLKIFSQDFKKEEMELIAKVDKILDEEYIQKRLNMLLDDFGDNMRRLLSRISRHFMFHDYTTEEEIIGWINNFEWEYTPHPSDLVEAGLMLRGNGNVVDDYSYHHSEQYRPENPFVLVSKHIHNTLRKKFIDKMWLGELGINMHSDTFNLLKMDHSVVGFGFEYYLSLLLVNFSQTSFEFVNNGVSHFFINIDKIKLPVNDIIIRDLRNSFSYVSLKAIKTLENEYIYLLSGAKSIDGLICLDNVSILYQCKFRYTQYDYSDKFLYNFDKQAAEIENRTANPVVRMLFTLKAPNDGDMNRLTDAGILVNSDLEAVFGRKMIKWLEDAKKSQISI